MPGSKPVKALSPRPPWGPRRGGANVHRFNARGERLIHGIYTVGGDSLPWPQDAPRASKADHLQGAL